MTIKDIAAESGYSLGTVSRVLNSHPGVSQKARDRVMAVVRKHRFQLNNNAKHLKQTESLSIAIVVKGTKNMLFASIVEILQELISKAGYCCLIYYTDELSNEINFARQVIRERQPKGILFLGSNQTFFEDGFSYIDIPCVIVTNSARELHFPKLSSVCIDDVLAAETAVRHLIGLGHRSIGVLGGDPDRSGAARVRFEGVKSAFYAEGIDFDPSTQYEISTFSMESGYHAMKRLLQSPRKISAVFAMADVLAIGAMRAIREQGLRVPEDISIIGFDGIELGGYLSPRLSTIKQPVREIASDSMKALLSCMQGGQPRHIIAPFTLISGESSQTKERTHTEEIRS